MNLTDEQLNIAICEWRGWTQCDPIKFESEDLFHFKGRGFCLRKDLPSHITGPEALGNMHEAEKKLTPKQRLAYADVLNDSLQGGFDNDYYDGWAGAEGPFCAGIFDVAHATAHQRATALLRVVKPEIFQ